MSGLQRCPVRTTAHATDNAIDRFYFYAASRFITAETLPDVRQSGLGTGGRLYELRSTTKERQGVLLSLRRTATSGGYSLREVWRVV